MELTGGQTSYGEGGRHLDIGAASRPGIRASGVQVGTVLKRSWVVWKEKGNPSTEVQRQAQSPSEYLAAIYEPRTSSILSKMPFIHCLLLVGEKPFQLSSLFTIRLQEPCPSNHSNHIWQTTLSELSIILSRTPHSISWSFPTVSIDVTDTYLKLWHNEDTPR